jgi:hypothetical protein
VIAATNRNLLELVAGGTGRLQAIPELHRHAPVRRRRQDLQT